MWNRRGEAPHGQPIARRSGRSQAEPITERHRGLRLDGSPNAALHGRQRRPLRTPLFANLPPMGRNLRATVAALAAFALLPAATAHAAAADLELTNTQQL